MKEITISLSETEAEALDRMAAIRGTTTDEVLKTMITHEYIEIDLKSALNENGYFTISPVKDLPDIIEQAFYNMLVFPSDNTPIDEKAVINAYNYAIEKKETHPNLQTLEAERDRFINEVIENNFF